MPKVNFNYADIPSVKLPAKTAVKQFIEELFQKENKVLHSLSYIFCSDSYLLNINQEFLNHDDYTDIITFDLSIDKNETIGEIYISVDRVKENATIHNTSFQNELLRVIFHGALHLCGYKDKTKSEITIMRNKEADYLRLFEKRN